MPLTLTRKYTFSAAHKLWNPAFSAEENAQHFGPCCRLHGHNYTLEITVAGNPSPQTGMIHHLGQLDELIHTHILSQVDHRYLDEDVPFLYGQLSTVENVTLAIFKRLAPHLTAPARLYRVRLYESPENWTEVLHDEPTR